MVDDEKDKDVCRRRGTGLAIKAIRSFRTLDLPTWFIGSHHTAFYIQEVTTVSIGSGTI